MNQSAGQIFLIPVRLNSKISHFFAAGNCGLALSTFISFFFVKRCSRSPPQTRARVLPPAAAPPQCKTALFLEEPVVDGGLLKRVLSGFLCSPSKHSEFLKRNKTQAAFRRAGTKKKGPKSVERILCSGIVWFFADRLPLRQFLSEVRTLELAFVLFSVPCRVAVSCFGRRLEKTGVGARAGLDGPLVSPPNVS